MEVPDNFILNVEYRQRLPDRPALLQKLLPPSDFSAQRRDNSQRVQEPADNQQGDKSADYVTKTTQNSIALGSPAAAQAFYALINVLKFFL